MDGDAPIELAFRSRADPRLRVEVLEMSEVLEHAPPGLARHEFSVIVIPSSADVTVEVDFEIVTVRPGEILRLRPGQVHRWSLDDLAADAVVLIAHRDVAQVWELDPAPWPPSAMLLDLSDDELRLLGSLLDSLRVAQDAFDGSAATHRTMELLVGAIATQLGAIEAQGVEAQQPTSELTRAFLAVVAATGLTRSVDEVAADLGYSPRHLTRTVTDQTGRPPRVWLRERTLLEAKRLLAHTDLSAAAIGLQLGFVDASHFSRAFRSGTGQPPSSFRRDRGG